MQVQIVKYVYIGEKEESTDSGAHVRVRLNQRGIVLHHMTDEYDNYSRLIGKNQLEILVQRQTIS